MAAVLDVESTSLAELRMLCRFCLKLQPSMIELLPCDLRASQIPELFKSGTALELTISPEYSSFLCTTCETNMRAMHSIREEFRRIDEFWRSVIKFNRKETPASANDGELIKLEVEEINQSGERSATILSLSENGSFETVEHTENNQIHYENVAENDDHDDREDSESDEDKPLISMVKNTTREYSDTPITMLECDMCGEKSKTKRILLRHMTTKHCMAVKPKSSTCNICGKTNLKRLAQHLRDHRKANKFRCSHCPRAFNRRTLLRQHERLHTGERPFVCEVCAFSFTSSAALKRHCKSHATDNEQPNVPIKQQAHRLRVNPTKAIPKFPPRQGIRLECPICHGTYVNRASLQPHMKLMHGADGLVAWKYMLETTCLVCNEKFECAEDLAKHKPQHIDHQCEICRRRFHSKITLELHVKNHSTKERKHQCEICEASYLCAFTLKNHIRRAHTSERPFQCTVCRNGFVERWELNTHMRKMHSFHKTLKPHQCSLCPETFKSKDALRSHTEKHTGQYRYWCEPCNRNLHSGPLLAEHDRSYHPERG